MVTEGSNPWRWSKGVTPGTVESSHLKILKERLTSNIWPQDTPSQIRPHFLILQPTEDKVFKHMSLWEPLPFKPTCKSRDQSRMLRVLLSISTSLISCRQDLELSLMTITPQWYSYNQSLQRWGYRHISHCSECRSTGMNRKHYQPLRHLPHSNMRVCRTTIWNYHDLKKQLWFKKKKGGEGCDWGSCVKERKWQEARNREQRNEKGTFFMSGVREILAASPSVMLTRSGMPGSKSILSAVQERLPSYMKLWLQNRHKRHAILSEVLNSDNLHAWKLLWHWLLLPPGPFCTYSSRFPFLPLLISLSPSSFLPLTSLLCFCSSCSSTPLLSPTPLSPPLTPSPPPPPPPFRGTSRRQR